MQDTKIPFGEREGQFFRAYDVKNGRACGCFCPGCGEPLNAANGGQKVIPHFRHVSSVDCVSGYKDGVRRAAVALIAAHRCILLPDYSGRITVDTESGHRFYRSVAFPVAEAIADTVERFVNLGGVIAHAVLTNGDRRLFVRIRISSRVESKKRERLKLVDASSIEIDLSGLSWTQINDPVSFEHAVLTDPSTRSWIRSLRAEMYSKHEQEQLAVEVARCNLHWRQEQGRIQEIEVAERAAREAREADLAATLQAHRKSQYEAAEAQRIAGAVRLESNPNDVAHRERLIVNQWLRAAREWDFKAAVCETCWLLSPQGNQFCLFCDSENSTKPYPVPRDIEATYRNRIRCSHRPFQSLQKAPVLLVLPDPLAPPFGL